MKKKIKSSESKLFQGQLSLTNQSIKQKLLVAFCLMSIIPLWISAYLAGHFIIPQLDLLWVDSFWGVTAAIVIGLIIALLGLQLAVEIIRPVIELAREMRLIVEGDFSRKIKVGRDDEIGDLGRSLNKLAARLYTDVEQTEAYEEEIQQVNFRIKKKIAALSSLLQIGSTISAHADLKAIFGAVAEGIGRNVESSQVFLFLSDGEEGEKERFQVSGTYDISGLEEVSFRPDEGFLGRVLSGKKAVFMDAGHPTPEDAAGFMEKHDFPNLLIAPVVLQDRAAGLLGVVSREASYIFQKEDLRLVEVFSGQIALAVENAALLNKTRELTALDETSGLYNAAYFRERLKEEIQRAIIYQRPCSLAILRVDDFSGYARTHGQEATDAVCQKIGQILRRHSGPIDRPARLEGGEFGLILPEKNKGEAREVAENITKEMESTTFPYDHNRPPGKLTVGCAVAANPIDGVTAEELVKKAFETLSTIESKGKNRVVCTQS